MKRKIPFESGKGHFVMVPGTVTVVRSELFILEIIIASLREKYVSCTVEKELIVV